MIDIEAKLSSELGVEKWQVTAAVQLIDEDNTIPFIARYRKEKTGALNDEVLRKLYERLIYLRNLEDKKQQVIATIRDQGKMTDALLKQIEEARTQVVVDDLYRPYRPKRRTRAMIAKEKGLEKLAVAVMAQNLGHPVEEEAADYVSEEKGVADVKEALEGASDILAESIADTAAYRMWIRQQFEKEGRLVSEAKDDKEKSVYEMYYHFAEPVSKIAGHRVLAINRAEKEKMVNVTIEVPEEKLIGWLKRQVVHQKNPYTTEMMEAAAEDSYRRLIAPAVEREVRNALTEKAEEGAMTVFGKNLKQLLMQPPIKGQTVLGWDPAFRTGCKLAVVDPTGKVLDTVVIYPTEPQKKIDQAKEVLRKLVRKYGITLISLGNGTASRESEQVIVDFLKEIPEKVAYVIVSEAGASVYSASKLATEEFPNFDVGQRSAASIARRLQDPLAELVKIDPKAIGVGQYQHDMNQKKLSEVLSGTVEDCVNKVGVDLNTASASLLEYISGISKTVAKNIVTYREENGRFDNRKQLLKVSKLGPKAYEQCAGFLRISDGSQPLDNTGVHPESYEAVEKLLSELGVEPDKLREGSLPIRIEDYEKMAAKLSIGEITLHDIVHELRRPGRDPREDMPKPVLRTDVLEMKDLKPGMILKGTVRNVIDFGVFVDIGVHQDGLVHISQISMNHIKSPKEALEVGQIVKAKVIKNDGGKISLSIKDLLEEKRIQEEEEIKNNMQEVESIGTSLGSLLSGLKLD